MKYWWNDKEVSKEEYDVLDEKWKLYVKELESKQKEQRVTSEPEKKPRKSKKA